MQRLEVSGAVRPLYGSLGVKGLMKLEFSAPRNPQICNFVEIHPVGVELFHEDGRTDGPVGMTRLIVAFSSLCQLRLIFF